MDYLTYLYQVINLKRCFLSNCHLPFPQFIHFLITEAGTQGPGQEVHPQGHRADPEEPPDGLLGPVPHPLARYTGCLVKSSLQVTTISMSKE